VKRQEEHATEAIWQERQARWRGLRLDDMRETELRGLSDELELAASRARVELERRQRARQASIARDLVCPILQERFVDPVVAADGHTVRHTPECPEYPGTLVEWSLPSRWQYERRAIVRWLASGHDTSPLTNERLPTCRLVPNLRVKAIMESLPEESA
jgi:hypothetical protein